jgi:hypothetical protein
VTDGHAEHRRSIGGALLAMALVMGYAAFWLPIPIAFDEYLALPIARAVADPTRYAAGDLLIQAGLRGPFHVYRAASVLYTRGLDVDLWWYIALLASLGALAAAVWRLATALGASNAARAFVTTLVCVSPFYRGTVNWSGLPLLWFVTASVAVPLAITAVAEAIAGRALLAAALVGLTFDVHPGAGVVAGAVTLAVLLADEGGPAVGRTARWLGIAALVAAPNIAFIAMGSIANFQVADGDRAAFWPIFRDFAYHVYPRDHWRQGYAWFALSVAAAAFALRHADAAIRRRVLAAGAAIVGTFAVYAIAIASERVPALALMFLARASWLAKPLIFVVVTDGVLRTWTAGARRPLVLGAAVAFALAVLHRNLGVGEGALAVALALWMLAAEGERQRVGAALFFGVGLALTWLSRGGAEVTPAHDAARALAMGMAVAATVMLLRVRRDASVVVARPVDGLLPLWSLGPVVVAIALGAHRAPATFGSIRQAMQLSRPAPAVAALSRWAADSTPPGSMFVVPPDDPRFVPFRLQTGRSLFIHASDIAQLSYDLSVYRTGFERLRAVGVRVIAPHALDSDAYATLDEQAFSAVARAGATFAVFERTASERSRAWPIAWRDDHWTVYRIGSPVGPSGNTQ